ncbi:hypothetical protein PP707_01325 [Acetobacter pasteurianus]|nr:hypothetical protein [Acetobacter pasteurianus]
MAHTLHNYHIFPAIGATLLWQTNSTTTATTNNNNNNNNNKYTCMAFIY